MWGQHLKEIPPYALKLGDNAPPLVFEFILQGPKSTEVNWDALRGKVVVLDFWGTWCAPCVAGIPHLNELASHYGKEPVQFIAVGHENPRKVRWFLQKHRIDAWTALDADLSVYRDYTAIGIPYTVIVDQNGRVAAVLIPKDLTEAVIDAVLAGGPTYPRAHSRRLRGTRNGGEILFAGWAGGTPSEVNLWDQRTVKKWNFRYS